MKLKEFFEALMSGGPVTFVFFSTMIAFWLGHTIGRVSERQKKAKNL